MTASDILIVGSGPAGVSAAWPLVEKGVGVLMVDAGGAKPPLSPQSDLAALGGGFDQWRTRFGDDLFVEPPNEEASPKLTTPIGRAVSGDFKRWLNAVTRNFRAVGSFGPGGLSRLWGAVSVAYEDGDLAAYPISRADLEPSYRRVSARIGLSGADDDLGDFNGLGLAGHEPPLLTPAAQRLLSAYRSRAKTPHFQLGYARNAVLSRDAGERSGCNTCGLCLWGCARGAIYNSASELYDLKLRKNFEYVGGMTIERIERATGGGYRLLGRSVDGAPFDVSAKRLVLATGTLASTRLLLGLFGHVGKDVKLLSNPLAAMTFFAPSLFGTRLPERSFSLAQLSYRLALSEDDYAMGMIYGADALPFSLVGNRIPLSRPVALRLSAAMAPGMLIASSYLSGCYSDNVLRLMSDGRVEIDGRSTSRAEQQFSNIKTQLGRVMRKSGYYFIPGSFTLPKPGSDVHYAGTIPMGGEGVLSCDAYGEVRDCPGLYVVDGSVLPTLPAKHVTLTIMANADRIARRICD